MSDHFLRGVTLWALEALLPVAVRAPEPGIAGDMNRCMAPLRID